MSTLAIDAAERGILPDELIRFGIRRLLRQRLREAAAPGATDRFIASLAEAPVALVPERANDQHYEVPTQFFDYALGPWRKYSCCYFDSPVDSLAQAEEAMLRLTCERAGIQDGMHVLDLGCGWGAVSLWIAERYPSCRVLGVSNSATQRAAILDHARERGLTNVDVITADVNTFDPGAQFDRIVSVEMFEHMRNVPQLLNRVASWLNPDGRLFVHVFCHDRYAYPYEDHGGDDDWMAQHFFSGGMMPSYDLLPHLAKDFSLLNRWRVLGTHYAQTCRAWLNNVDAHRDDIEAVFARAYGPVDAPRWVQRWRMFFLACEELFAFHRGREWYVGHYLFERHEQ
jgi:cyclopropane-fatty-acyl-phospholipid synthase